MSLAALCRPVSRREVLLMALVAISPMTVYALERANNDLVVFFLTVLSVALIRKRRTARWSGYALFLFAALLKYYPLVLLAMIAREERRDAIGFAAIALTILAVLLICNHAEIAAALAIIPKPSYFANSFAAANLAFGLGEILGSPFARGIVASLLAILAMVTGARILRLVHVVDQARIDWTTLAADCLIAGALLLTACFFAAQNVYYRGVYFVLIMPGLLQLRRGAATGEAHRLLSLVLAAIIFVMWEEPLHCSVHLVAASLRFGSGGAAHRGALLACSRIGLVVADRQPRCDRALLYVAAAAHCRGSSRTREVFAQTPVMVTLAARANAECQRSLAAIAGNDAMSIPWRAASAINACGSAPARSRVSAHDKVERVPLRQWATTGCGAASSAAAKASTSARDRLAAVIGMW